MTDERQETMQLVLPWPPSILSPNSRKHWKAKMKPKAKYREDCRLLATQVIPTHYNMIMTFHPPDRRLRDDDNCVGAAKSLRDGLADAWFVNDRIFRFRYEFAEPVKGGKIVITWPGNN